MNLFRRVLHRILPLAIVAVGLLECVLTYELVQDRRYLHEEVGSGNRVETARGSIRKVKWHSGGKAKPRIAVSVKDYPKWLYLNSGTREEFAVLQAGNTLEARVYRPRPDALLTRSFLRDHVLFTLDVVVDGNELRDAASIRRQISANLWGIVMTMGAALVTFVAAWVSFRAQSAGPKSEWLMFSGEQELAASSAT